MVLLTVNIPFELREKLRNEDNQSGLISELLTKHYKGLKTEEQILKETEENIKKKQEDEEIAKIIEEQLTREKEMFPNGIQSAVP